MNRTYFALFVAILIHLLFALIIWILLLILPKQEEIKKDENRIKIALRELPPKPKVEANKPPPQDIVAPPMPKGSQLKELIKVEEPKIREQVKPQKPKVETKKEIQQTPKNEPLPPTYYIPLPQEKVEKTFKKEELSEKKSDPLSWLKEDHLASDIKNEPQQKSRDGSRLGSDIRELYGDEFGKLSQVQQQYLLDNQEIMRRITQEVLNRVASVNLNAGMNVKSSNIIEFYLHPNGDMSDFRFLTKSGYYELDRTTKETIEYAYSRYPRPKEKTLIRYNVYYHLSSY